MPRKRILRVSILILSMIIVGGLLTQAPNVTTNNSTGFGTTVSSFAPSFDGTSYSSTWSPRTVDEYLFGINSSVREKVAGSVLNVFGPSGGAWTGRNFNTTVYNLFEKTNFLRNANFTDQSGGYPLYWSNSSPDDPQYLKPLYDTGNRWVYFSAASHNFLTKANSSWSQTIFLNRTNVASAWISFRVWRNNPSGGGSPQAFNATVYVNRTKVWTRFWENLFLSSYRHNVTLPTSLFQSLPGNVIISLNFSLTKTYNNIRLREVYFDSLYLSLDCQPFPESVQLKLGSKSVVGDNYGRGKVNNASISLPNSYTFSSNSTVHFKSNSSIGIYRRIQSDSVAFKATQGSPNVSWKVNRSSALNNSNQVFGSISYTQYLFNVSIPHDWNYTNIQFPNGTLRNPDPPLVQKYENGSYSWIIMINVTAIGSYRPNPYVVRAESPNYVGSVSTYRLHLGSWLANDTFTRQDQMKVNATVQGQASKGSAYVVFYFASNHTVHINESSHSITPGSGGIVSFNFTWSNGNVSRSDLWTLVLWSNGTSVAANWALIKFDLDPPQVRISSLSGNVYVSPTGGTYGAGNITVGVVAPDAHHKNMTLLIDDAPVKTWNYSTSATYKWNTTVDGNFTLELIGYDQFDQPNETTRYVYVDNTGPSYPSLIYPNLNDVLNLNSPTLSWGASGDSGSGTSTYTLYLDTSPSLGSGNLRILSNLVNANYTVPSGQPLSADTWWWRVCAIDHLGNRGANSSSRNFTVSPSMVSIQILPDTNVIARTGGTFVTGSIRLRLYVHDTLIRNASLLTQQQSTWQMLKLWSSPPTELNVTYSLDTKVNTTSGFVNLVLRDVNMFNSTKEVTVTAFVDDVGPSPPTLSYPNDGDLINVTTPTFIWGATSDADGVGVEYYILQLDTSQFFNSSNLRTVTNIMTNSYAVSGNESLKVNETWYWRTCAVDYLGNIGDYSVSRSFYTLLPVPSEGIPVLLILEVVGIPSAVAILSSVVILRRKTKEVEAFDRKNLIAAYIFSNDGRCMFTHQFKEVKIEPQLLSGFLTAISNMMKEVVGGSGRALRTIEQPDAKILVELGDITTGALVAKKASREYRRRLKSFLNRFEHDYAGKISQWDGGDVFADASEIIEEVFTPRVKVTTYPTIIGVEDLLVDKKIGSVAVSVAGKTGSGKSTFCLRHAASLLKRGHPVIIVDGSMPPKDVRKELRTGGVDVGKLEEQGLLILYDAYSEISGIESKEKYKLGSPGELNTINLSLSRNLGKLKNATVFFDSLTAMIEYSDLELAVDFIRTIKVKLQQGEHTAFFIIDSNAHDTSTLNYINHVMDGEIETAGRRTKKGETERLVSFKRLNGFQIKTGYHQIQ